MRVNADSRVTHAKVQHQVGRGSRPHSGRQCGQTLHLHRHLACLRKFDGIAQQVKQDLAQPGGVADDDRRQIVGQATGQPNLFLARLVFDDVHRRVDVGRQVKRLQIQLHFACFELRRVKNVIDQSQ